MTFRDGWKRLQRIGRPSAARDVDSEIAFHFEQKIQDFVASGMSERDARARASEEFGDVDDVRDRLRAIDERLLQKRRRAEWWEAGAQDIRYVVRTLRRSPGFTIGVVLTLALGLGANAALFSILDRLYLRDPVGVVHPENLRRIYQQSNNKQHYLRRGLSYPEIERLRAALPPTVALALYRAEKVALGPDIELASRNAAFVGGDYFGLLGAKVAIGRFFSTDEMRMQGLTPVVVLSHGLWQAQFGGDSAIVGKMIELGSHRYAVIGVAASGFRGADLSALDLWLPYNAYGSWKNRKPDWFQDRNHNGIFVIARIPANTETLPLDARITPALRDTSIALFPKADTFLSSIHEARVDDGRYKESAISLRLGGVALVVLLIACANVVNLLLARAMRRRREIALRLALGVSRTRLMMQFVIESGMLAVLAGSVALAVAGAGATLLHKLLLPDVQWDTSSVTDRVAVFTIVLSLVVGFLAGLLPAMHASRPDVAGALRGGNRDGASHKSRLRTGMLIMQAAMSVVLLAGAGVFVRSLRNVESVDIGYATDQLLFARVAYNSELEDHSAELTSRTPDVAERIARLPGVQSVAMMANPPLYGFSFDNLRLPGRDSLPPNGGMSRIVSYVSPKYFETVGIRVLRGRAFVDGDRAGAASVIAMNEEMANNLWPGEDALTKCLYVGDKDVTCRAVVAIVSHANFSSILEGRSMQYYVPLAQSGDHGSGAIAVRAAPDRVAEVGVAVRTLIKAELGPWARPRLLVMREMLAPEMRPWRVGATLFSAAGILALIVAAVGVYSSLAYTISQRAHEMGVRVALGARGTDIVRLVINEGVRVVAFGVALGIAAALALGKVVESLLYNTSSRDPLVLGSVAAVLVLVAVIACLIPARRAARTDPMDALRAE